MAKVQEVLFQLGQQLNRTVKTAEAKLQIEESGNKIANLQGYCAGERSYWEAMRQAGYVGEVEENDEADLWINIDGNGDEDCDLSWQNLQSVKKATQELRENETYKALQEEIRKEVNKKKDMLFYGCEKGRDLFWCKGWYEAITKIEDWIKRLDFYYEINLQKAQKQEQEKKEMLPFEQE